jgi:hypothetical protein
MAAADAGQALEGALVHNTVRGHSCCAGLATHTQGSTTAKSPTESATRTCRQLSKLLVAPYHMRSPY